MRKRGLEPLSLTALDPKSSVSANSTTSAQINASALPKLFCSAPTSDYFCLLFIKAMTEYPIKYKESRD